MTDAGAPAAAVAGPLSVVATAGHVDHGKSSLIVGLTGMDPDRFAEEKRRGLTIDLGFAWCTLPSGREIGFVDVPGHERFVRNMLAGVGPIRLVLFVVAADEGWKPQSEEHLAIVDVLGVDGAVVALTKSDLVDEAALERAAHDVRERLRGTGVADAPIIPCSSVTGVGLDALEGALDGMLATAPKLPDGGRPRQFVDRVFTIKGSGTVVTGTLTGGPLAVGREVELYPTGERARVRSLQTHKRSIAEATPVSRVAANLVGAQRERIRRGDVVGVPGQWRPTRTFEARIRPIRGLQKAPTARGAYKLYAGSAERDATVRLYGDRDIPAPEGSFARIRISSPLVLDVFDRFVLRDSGRRQTVAGGIVLDPDPPARAGTEPERRLERRARAVRAELPALLISERGAVRSADVGVLTGIEPTSIPGAVRAGAWWVGNAAFTVAAEALEGELAAFHANNPLIPGADLAIARESVSSALARAGVRDGPSLVDAVLDALMDAGRLSRQGATVGLASHVVDLRGHEDEVEKVVRTIGEAEPAPPSIDDLVASGVSRDLIDAATRAGLLARISSDLVMTPAFVARAEEVVRASGTAGITVSAFREQLGTSRKFAVPLLEYLDQRKLTVRRGDLRFPRAPADPPR
jgi:selenocysteine-specific elongation factor